MLDLLIGLTLIGIIPLIYIIARSLYIGDWHHPKIDNSWDPNKSRGKIK